MKKAPNQCLGKDDLQNERNFIASIVSDWSEHDRKAWAKVKIPLKPALFEGPKTRAIYEVLLQFRELEVKSIFSGDVVAALKAKGHSHVSANDVVEILEANSSLNINYFADNIYNAWMESRQLEITKSGLSALEKGEALSSLYAEHSAVNIGKKEISTYDFTDGIDLFESLWERRSKGRFLETGLVDLDSYIDIEEGNLIFIGARSGDGKSSFAFNLVNNIAVKDKKEIVFSMEMPKIQVMSWLIGLRERLDTRTLKIRPSEDRADRVYQSVKYFQSKKIWIVPGMKTVSELKAICDLYVGKHGELHSIVIDYLGIIKPEKKAFSKEDEISDIASSLKELATSLQIAVFCLCQFNRDILKRKEKDTDVKIPVMSDLKGSGGIEANGDVVLGITRGKSLDSDDLPIGTEVMEIHIMKNRDGGGYGSKLRRLVAGDGSRALLEIGPRGFS